MNLTAGEHELSIQFNGNDNYFDSALTSRVKIKSRVVLSLEYDVYQNSAVLKVYLSKAVNDIVVVKVNDITRFGEVIYLNNLSNGIYNVDVSLENANDDYAFENVIDSFAIDVKKTEIIASELQAMYIKYSQIQMDKPQSLSICPVEIMRWPLAILVIKIASAQLQIQQYTLKQQLLKMTH